MRGYCLRSKRVILPGVSIFTGFRRRITEAQAHKMPTSRSACFLSKTRIRHKKNEYWYIGGPPSLANAACMSHANCRIDFYAKDVPLKARSDSGNAVPKDVELTICYCGEEKFEMGKDNVCAGDGCMTFVTNWLTCAQQTINDKSNIDEMKCFWKC